MTDPTLHAFFARVTRARSIDLALDFRGDVRRALAEHLRDTPGERRAIEDTLRRAGASALEVADFLATFDRPERFRPLTVADLATLPKPAWRIEGIIQQASEILLYGPPGCGKTFVALDWALSVSLGVPWFGRACVQCPVVYVIGEGLVGFYDRVHAWETARGLSAGGAMFFVGEPVNLFNADECKAFADAIGTLEPGLIIFDTYARCSEGADENSAQHMGTIVRNLDRLKVELNSGLLLVHHPLKSGGSERGSSALGAAIDTKLQLENHRNSMIRTLSCEKQKHAPAFDSLQVTLRECDGSLVLEDCSERAGKQPEITAAHDPKEVLVATAIRKLHERGAYAGTATRMTQNELVRAVGGNRSETIRALHEAALDERCALQHEEIGRSLRYYVLDSAWVVE